MLSLLLLNAFRDGDIGVNEDVTYEVRLIKLYSGDLHQQYLSSKDTDIITFVTAGSSAACGVVLKLDQDYLIHLHYDDYSADLRYSKERRHGQEVVNLG